MMSIAATSQAASGLSVTAPDDDMELGSDFGRNDEDIDIDIDIGPQEQDEDFVLEDARSDYGMEHNDDIMIDDQIETLEDKAMQDNMTVNDEHLTDASEISQDDTNFTAFNATRANDLTETADDEIIDYNNEVVAHEEHGQAPPQSFEDTSASPEQGGDSVATQQQSASIHRAGSPKTLVPQDLSQGSPRLTPEKQDTYQPEASREIVEEHSAHNSLIDNHAQAGEHAHNADVQPSAEAQSSEQGVDLQKTDNTLLNVHNEVNSKESMEEQSGDYETYNNSVGNVHTASLHPVIVYWKNNEMSLFPSEDATYFLQDEAIGYEKLEALFQACRKQLGDDVGDEDELVMDFHDFGLSISEDSTHCAESKLSDILDVYTLLHQQDGANVPDPFHVTLATKTRFSFRLNQLTEAACEGKGMSQLTFLKNEDEYNTEHYSNNYDGDEQYEEQENFEEKFDQQFDGDEFDDAEGQAKFLGEEAHSAQHAENHPEAEEDPTPAELSATNENDAESNETEHSQKVEKTVITDVADDRVSHGNVSVESSEHSVADNTPADTNQDREDDDFIDYDDDDDDDPGVAQEPELDPVGNGRSSGSSTVQGDQLNTPYDTAGFDMVDNAVSSEFNGNQANYNDAAQSYEAEAPEYYEYEYQEIVEESFNTVQGDDENRSAEGGESFVEATNDLYSLDHQEPPPGKEEATFEGESASLENKDNQDDADYEQDHNEQYDTQEFYQEDETIHNEEEEEGDSILANVEKQSENDSKNEDVIELHDDETADFGEADHGDFDYPEFADDTTKVEDDHVSVNEVEETQANDGHESDIIDYSDDDEDAPQSPAVHEHPPEPTRSSASPRTKRSREEQDDGVANSSSPQSTKRVRSR